MAHYTPEVMAALLSSEIEDGNKRDMPGRFQDQRPPVLIRQLLQKPCQRRLPLGYFSRRKITQGQIAAVECCPARKGPTQREPADERSESELVLLRLCDSEAHVVHRAFLGNKEAHQPCVESFGGQKGLR